MVSCALEGNPTRSADGREESNLLQSLEERFRKDDYDFNAEELRCNYILNRIKAIAKIVKP